MFFSKSNFIVLFFLIIFSSSIFIDLGFALKGFMILTFFGIFFYIKNFKLIMSVYDIFYLLLIYYGSITVLFSADPISGMRLAIGSIILVFYYYFLKYLLFSQLVKSKSIFKPLVIAAFVFTFFSILAYLISLNSISFNILGNNNTKLIGVIIERGLPRLIGFTQDPNIFVFTVLIPFWYLFCKKQKNNFEKLTLLLISISVIMSLSRGGIISILIPLIFILISSLIKLKIKHIVVALVIVSILFNILDVPQVHDVLDQRMSTISSGSGRFEIWKNGIELWSQNPFFGIGWYNFLYYNINFYGGTNYAHNTFLEVLVELGLVGFTIYFLFHTFLFVKIKSLIKREPNMSFILPAYFSSIILMSSLSLIINEVFFIIPAFVSVYLKIIKTNENSVINFNPK